MTYENRVTICTVTRDAEADIDDFFASLSKVHGGGIELVLVDCASSDSTLVKVAAQRLSWPTTVIPLDVNLGFAGGMNRAISETSAPFVLSLNADTRPDPAFVESLVGVLADPSNARLAAVTGRLQRSSKTDHSVLDAAGMMLRASWRHLDRGSGERDTGQYGEPARVFGGTGAATLFRRAALEDVAIAGEVFLEEFHSYREDAELSFRLRERGWEIVYEPSAVCLHDRKNLPQRRREMSALINYHSVKNRYLLRTYHETLTTFLVTLLPSLFREVAILAYVLAIERTSLRSFGWLWRNRRLILSRRHAIQARRTTSEWATASWFLSRSRPL